MPRPASSSHRRVHNAVDNNPYHAATLSTTNSHARQNGPSTSRHGRERESRKYRNSYRKTGYHHNHNTATIDTGLSDPTFTENESYYDYWAEHGGYSNSYHRNHRDSRSTQYSLSDESGSIRLPLYDTDDVSTRRFSRNAAPSDRSFVRPHQYLDNNVNTHSIHRDHRKIYPDRTEYGWDRLYQEIPTPCEDAPASSSSSQRVPPSRVERPQSSVSSAVTTTVVSGCGGKCQTFENICYFFLQLVFTMGILVGLSLCFAAAALSKSAARNLQVLVYIGVLVFLVCSLLLGIQCRSRYTAIKRRRAVKLAIQRAPIPLEPLNQRDAAVNQVEEHLVLMQDGSQRIPLQQVHVNRPLPPRPHGSESPSLVNEPTNANWRRQDLNVFL